MDFNFMRVRASDLYLIRQWNNYAGSPTERRRIIFREFIKLGMRRRWEWHGAAERYEYAEFTEAEKEILECRTREVRDVTFWMNTGDGLARVLMTVDKSALEKSDDWPEYWSNEENPWLVCLYDDGEGPFDTLPELVYSMTAYDDPDDVAEARSASIAGMDSIEGVVEPDQTLWVSGVFRIDDRIFWTDEFGETIRESVFDAERMEKDSELFESYRPFETSWWMEGARVGKYAEREWWL